MPAPPAALEPVMTYLLRRVALPLHRVDPSEVRRAG